MIDVVPAGYGCHVQPVTAQAPTLQLEWQNYCLSGDVLISLLSLVYPLEALGTADVPTDYLSSS